MECTSNLEMYDNREDARPKSKADGVYNNPSPLDGDPSVYDNKQGLPYTKVKLKETTGLDSQLMRGILILTTQVRNREIIIVRFDKLKVEKGTMELQFRKSMSKWISHLKYQ